MAETELKEAQQYSSGHGRLDRIQAMENVRRWGELNMETNMTLAPDAIPSDLISAVLIAPSTIVQAMFVGEPSSEHEFELRRPDGTQLVVMQRECAVERQRPREAS
jgi:hypothetical protein